MAFRCISGRPYGIRTCDQQINVRCTINRYTWFKLLLPEFFSKSSGRMSPSLVTPMAVVEAFVVLLYRGLSIGPRGIALRCVSSFQVFFASQRLHAPKARTPTPSASNQACVGSGTDETMFNAVSEVQCQVSD